MTESIWVVEDDRELRSYIVDLPRDAGQAVEAFGSAMRCAHWAREAGGPDQY